MNKIGLALSVVVLSILFIVWWPLAVIWSLNTLFDTGIPYRMDTWASVFVLVTILRVATLFPEKRKS